MSETEKEKKSVKFSESTTAIDPPNGDKMNSTESKTDGVEEVTDMFKGLAKKKTSKKPKEKKASKPAADSFEAKLAEAGVGEEGEGGNAVAEVPKEDGDPEKGTGIWGHNVTTAISYPSLLKRFYLLLDKDHPDMLSGGSKSYKIPPPQCLREGNKKTIFANISEICKRMHREDAHVTSFLFAELGTSGSVDGSSRLVIKGRFQQKQIENVLRRYIVEYVSCKTCKSPDTLLQRGESRLYYVECKSCGSRRSVTAIKSGFSAQIGKRKRQQT